MSAPTQIDYDALAKKYGATVSVPGTPGVNYDALAKKYGATSSKPVSVTTGTISAEPPADLMHPLNWLQQAKDDIQQGTGSTWVGRTLRALGAPGTQAGVSPGQAAFMGGPLEGPVKMAHGLGTVMNPAEKDPEAIKRGANEAFEGAGQVAAPVMAVVAPEALPELVPGMVEAGGVQQGITNAAKAAGASDDTAELLGNVGTVGYLGAKGKLARKPAAEVITKPASTAAEAASNIPDAVSGAVEATGDAAKGAVSKVLPALVDGPPEDLMTRAVKPGKNNVGWQDDIQSALPQMKAAEADLGRPVRGINDALEAAQLAKKKIWAQYEQRLGPAARMGATIDGDAVADAMMGSIDRRTATQNPELADKVAQVADTYRRPMSVEDAEDFLQSANNDLHNYYAKNKVGRQVALGDPTMAYTVAEADALRQALYDKLDEVTGPGAADLKKQYGALTNVQNELQGRMNVAARQQPQSLSEQLSTALGYGKIAKGVLTMSPGDIVEGAHSVAASKYLKERNSTDAMITRAFQATEPAAAPEVPQQPKPAGLLPAGTVITPRPADASGTPPEIIPPRYEPTTRAQRKGLLLPERTAIDLPTPSDASGGPPVKPNVAITRNPATGRMQRQYLTSGTPAAAPTAESLNALLAEANAKLKSSVSATEKSQWLNAAMKLRKQLAALQAAQ